MKKLYFIFIFSIVSIASGQENLELLKNEADQIIKQFSKELKTELVKAMQDGGPVNAINVCNVKAPKISAQITDTSNWIVARTSLKARNDKNIPDEYETEILKQFEEELKAGKDVNQLFSINETEDGIRYLKAIPTGSICLQCHGDNLSEELKAELVKLYPNDKAVGFKNGDIRGAFTLIKK